MRKIAGTLQGTELFSILVDGTDAAKNDQV